MSSMFYCGNKKTWRLKSPVHYLVILFLLIANVISAHDIALAMYNVSQEKNTLKIIIEIDKKDIDKVIQTNKTSIKKYLKSNMAWSVNGKGKPFKIKKIQPKDELYYIECIVKKTPKDIQNIEVKNTVLIDTVEKHSNILTFQLHDSERTFRLHKERVQTLVEY